MDRESVDSTMISSIGYDPSVGVLEVEFRANGQVWQYYDVTESTYNDLRSAESLGAAFHIMIKRSYKEARIG